MSVHEVDSNGGPQFAMTSRRIQGFEISWAGHCPFNNGFAYGSDDGRFLISNESGGDIRGTKDAVVPSKEAINGVAFSGDIVALSTRADVAFTSLPPGSGKGFRAVLQKGAHGVIATSSGTFVAPMGRAGLMQMVPTTEQHQPVTLSRAVGETFDFYRATSIRTSCGKEFVACAARRGGLVFIDHSAQPRRLDSLAAPGLDIVDICPLGTGLPEPAVASLGKDCTIVLTKNILRDRIAVVLRFAEIAGTAYRLLYTKGHLLLLTNKALYMFVGLASRFLQGDDFRQVPVKTRGIPIQAVDANTAGDKWVVVVVVDGSVLIEVDRLAGTTDDQSRVDDFRPNEAPFEWDTRQIEVEANETLLSVG